MAQEWPWISCRKKQGVQEPQEPHERALHTKEQRETRWINRFNNATYESVR